MKCSHCGEAIQVSDVTCSFCNFNFRTGEPGHLSPPPEEDVRVRGGGCGLPAITGRAPAAGRKLVSHLRGIRAFQVKRVFQLQDRMAVRGWRRSLLDPAGLWASPSRIHKCPGSACYGRYEATCRGCQRCANQVHTYAAARIARQQRRACAPAGRPRRHIICSTSALRAFRPCHHGGNMLKSFGRVALGGGGLLKGSGHWQAHAPKNELRAGCA